MCMKNSKHPYWYGVCFGPVIQHIMQEMLLLSTTRKTEESSCSGIPLRRPSIYVHVHACLRK